MNTKTYKLANKKKFQVEYGFKGGKWTFRIGSFTLLTKVPGGKENADRISEILRKSWLRCGEIDGNARNAVNRIVNANFKALKDYKGKWDHGYSFENGGRSTMDPNISTVKMISPNLPVVEAEPVTA